MKVPKGNTIKQLQQQHPKRQQPRISDDQVRDHLNAMGFFDSWITQDLLNAQRKILEAKKRNQMRLANAGDYD
jgi:hypothetical protein